jgi:hypothetical protein
VVTASIFPDLVDKPLRFVFHQFEFGRNIMHSLPGLVVISLIFMIIFEKRVGFNWAVGHMGHIGADVAGDIVSNLPVCIPWLWPFVGYYYVPVSYTFRWQILFTETILTAMAVFLLWPNIKVLRSRLKNYHRRNSKNL